MSILHTEEVHLIDYLRVLYKRRVFFAVVIAAALGGTIYSTWRQTPIYSSSTRILVDNDETIVDFPGVERRGLLRLDTEMHIMRSREVAEHAVLTRIQPGMDRKDPEFERLVTGLVTSTGVEIVKNTLIVEMRALADDPEKARKWCEAMAESYVEVNFASKKDANSAAATAIKEEIQQTQRELESAEHRLLEFKSEHNIVSDVAKAAEVGTRTGAATSAIADAETQRINFDMRYRALANWKRNNDFSMPLPPDIAPSVIVNQLYEQIVKKRVEYKSLLSRYTEQHPKVVAGKAEMETLRRNFDGEVENALQMLHQNAQLYADMAAAHKVGAKHDKSEIIEENQRDWNYTVLQRNVDVMYEIYKALLQKLGEINVTTSILKNTVRIIERPKAIPIPIRPNWRFNLLVGVVFGLGVAVAGVFFLEYLDKTLKTPDDIARYLGLPVLAVVPLARAELLRAPYEAPQIREGETGALSA